jgi:hypothetical protein
LVNFKLSTLKTSWNTCDVASLIAARFTFAGLQFPSGLTSNMIRRRFQSTLCHCAAAAISLFVILAANNCSAQSYRVVRIASGLAQPTYVAQAPGDPANVIYYSTRISAANGTGGGFSTIKNMGGIFRYDMNTRTSTPIMNLSYRTLTGDEGLVGFAFSPDFNTLGSPGYQKLYVSSSEYSNGASPIERVEEYTASGPHGTVPVDGLGRAVVSRLILQYNNINTDGG